MLGTTVGSHRLVSKLGEGAMGAVYLAEHSLLGSLAAVKVLLPHHASDPAVVQRFFNEARAASAIKHLGIVEIFDVGRLADGTSYLVMELLRGESLARRLERGGLTLTQVVSVVAQVASALAAAHRVGVVHRDVKPENIFLLDDRGAPAGVRAKLLDFGVAKLTGDRDPHLRTQIGVVLGTPEYMAPEQVRGDGDVDHRADLYALGCLLFRLLAGRPPFTGELADVMRAHLLEPAPSMRSIDPRLPAELDQLVQALLAKDPGRRPRSADDVVAALGGLGGGLLLPAVSSPLVPIDEMRRGSPTTLGGASGIKNRPGLPRRRPRRIAAFVAAMTAIAGAGLFGVWLGRRERDADAVPLVRLVAPRPRPITAPPPLADAELEALLGPPPPPAAKRHRPARAAAKSCVSGSRHPRAGSAAPRGRSPC